MIELPPQISQEEYLKVLLTDPLEKLKAIIEKNKKDHRIDRRTEHTEQEVLQAQQKRTGGRSFVFRLDWQCLVRFFLY